MHLVRFDMGTPGTLCLPPDAYIDLVGGESPYKAIVAIVEDLFEKPQLLERAFEKR